MQTNPVQQRMDYLVDSWNNIPKEKIKLIRAVIEPGDEKMIETFYSYMLGVNVPVYDIAIHLSTGIEDEMDFSRDLLEELENMVNLWNAADFSKTTVDKVVINWQPDYTLTDKKNQAKLFVDNLNRLADVMELQKEKSLVVNLLLPSIYKKKRINKWLEQYLVLNIHPQLKLLLTEVSTTGMYEELSIKYAEDIFIWQPRIDTPNVMNQVAAMGDPQDPGTNYRLSFTKMMKAIGQNQTREARKEANTCLQIASNYVTQDPYWITQIIAVNIAMSNHYFKEGEMDEAYSEANAAIKMGQTVPEVLGVSLGCGILSQAQINKATMLCVNKKWKEASALYEQAGVNLEKSNVIALAIESRRMAAYCHLKKYSDDQALENLVEGYNLSDRLSDNELKNSTFSILLQLLLKLNYKEFISPAALEEKAGRIYGEYWREKIKEKWSMDQMEDLYEENRLFDEQINRTS